MFRNYLITALRFLKRNKLFAGINILGLSLALAATFIILLFVINELSYNSCYKNRKQIYRVIKYYVDDRISDDETSYVLSKSIKEEFSQIKHVASIKNMGKFSIKLNDEYIPVRNALGTDSEVFKIFDIPVTGQQENILDKPNSIVLSQKQAQKFFPTEDPIGKELVTLVNDREEVFVVKGVFDDIPVNSTLQADCFINSKWLIEQLNQKFKDKNAETDWHSDFWWTWVLLDEKADVALLDEQFGVLAKKVLGEKNQYDLFIQNLSDVYLGSQGFNTSAEMGSMKNIRIFSVIALLIIIVASFNYILLSTAVSTGRTKEIGIRKTNGASAYSIRKQLLNESVILTMLVLPIALFLAWLGKPFAEDLFQSKLSIIHSNIIIYIVVYVALTLFIGLASGLYTSSFLSKLNVIGILKNPVQTGKHKSRVRFALIVVQLVIFCSFISSTLIIRSQYQYALEKNPGYRNNDILFVNVEKIPQNSAALINSIRAYPDVISAGGAVEALPMINSMPWNIDHFQDKSKKVSVELLGVDYDFVKTMGIQLLEGRGFSREFSYDGKNSYLVNEAAVKALGITEPVGKPIDDGTIIGVVKDFNLHSIHSSIPPLMLAVSDAFVLQLAIRYKPGSLKNLLPLIEAEWKKVAPDQPFNYKTIEEFSKEIYTEEKNLSVIISIFALFSLLIASLGLFGVTLFIAKSRTKEIGVKKVLGSSSNTIIYSFLKGNLLPVFIASLLSVPITWYFMDKWLTNFSYKAEINLWFFIISCVVAILVIGATGFFHSYRASRTNPVEALRYE
ncbi:MAG TPA: FtsX-like permease family protein [Prolixibacteraceae bacterium]|nr:FtsX-like permease family protein [Prolixibacteraceae bacterium]